MSVLEYALPSPGAIWRSQAYVSRQSAGVALPEALEASAALGRFVLSTINYMQPLDPKGLAGKIYFLRPFVFRSRFRRVYAHVYAGGDFACGLAIVPYYRYLPESGDTTYSLVEAPPWSAHSALIWSAVYPDGQSCGGLVPVPNWVMGHIYHKMTNAYVEHGQVLDRHRYHLSSRLLARLPL